MRNYSHVIKMRQESPVKYREFLDRRNANAKLRRAARGPMPLSAEQEREAYLAKISRVAAQSPEVRETLRQRQCAYKKRYRTKHAEIIRISQKQYRSQPENRARENIRKLVQRATGLRPQNVPSDLREAVAERLRLSDAIAAKAKGENQ